MVYSGGGMPESEEEGQRVMAAWGQWYGNLGEKVVDGGNPFGPSMSVAADGKTSQGPPSNLSGYTIVSADSMDAATAMAKDCPILDSGGRVDVYETFRMM